MVSSFFFFLHAAASFSSLTFCLQNALSLAYSLKIPSPVPKMTLEVSLGADLYLLWYSSGMTVLACMLCLILPAAVFLPVPPTWRYWHLLMLIWMFHFVPHHHAIAILTYHTALGTLSTAVPWALSVNLETAWQERSVLLAGDKRLLREGGDVVLLSNQKGNYETLTKPRLKAR